MASREQRVQALLERCDPVHLDLDDAAGTEREDDGEVEQKVSNLTWCYHQQKLLYVKSCTLDDMMQLLEGLESPDQLLNEPCPPDPGNKAASRFKALKEEYREGLEEVERLIAALVVRLEQLQHKRNRLTHLVTALENKRQQSRQLQEALPKAHNALHVCEGQLSQLREEMGVVLERMNDWGTVRDQMLGRIEQTQAVMQYATPSEVCVELRPRSLSSSPSAPLLPLRLTVTWSADDHFLLQVFEGTAGMLEESVKGRLSEFNAALLEVMNRYTSQGEMLGEIQSLHSSYAIDWRPGQRLLVFLKSSAVVCTLAVEEGYPSRGHASLASVCRDGDPLNTQDLQPPQKTPSLTDWLKFLSSNPHV